MFIEKKKEGSVKNDARETKNCNWIIVTVIS